MKKSELSIFSLYFFVLCLIPVGIQGQQIPERIILNLTDDPETEIAVTWRTIMENKGSMAQFAKATPWKTFLLALDSLPAQTEKFQTDRGEQVFHHSVVMTGLEPGAKYIYRVGSPAGWSEWNQFHTAPANASDFTFIWFGDPQNDILEHCSRIFREAYRKSPEAAFWLYAGDLITEPEDRLYGEFFEAAGFILRMTPQVMAPGNHDRNYRRENGKFVTNAEGRKIRMNEVSDEWRKHFTLPENGPEGLEETAYFIDYGNVRLIQLNSNMMLEEQALWLDSILRNNKQTWNILTFHHPFYSGGRNRNHEATRKAFRDIVDRYHVDLVLTGHDHTYLRSYKLVNDRVVSWDQPGTVYALSVSGPKQYTINPAYPDLMEKTGENMQLYQVISISGNTLTYAAYTVSGELYDRFVLKK
jgi:3',5'-cyclic AMP phosphodiesterase CpdA